MQKPRFALPPPARAMQELFPPCILFLPSNLGLVRGKPPLLSSHADTSHTKRWGGSSYKRWATAVKKAPADAATLGGPCWHALPLARCHIPFVPALQHGPGTLQAPLAAGKERALLSLVICIHLLFHNTEISNYIIYSNLLSTPTFST